MDTLQSCYSFWFIDVTNWSVSSPMCIILSSHSNQQHSCVAIHPPIMIPEAYFQGMGRAYLISTSYELKRLGKQLKRFSSLLLNPGFCHQVK